jgi:hypothetical protein
VAGSLPRFRSPPRTQLPDLFKNGVAIEKFAAVGLFDPAPQLGPQFLERGLPGLLAFLEQPQSFANDFAARVNGGRLCLVRSWPSLGSMQHIEDDHALFENLIDDEIRKRATTSSRVFSSRPSRLRYGMVRRLWTAS